jgi:hypothetical protein
VVITAKVVISNPAHDKVYSIQHYAIDLRQVGGFLWILRFPPPIKLTAMIYLLKVALITYLPTSETFNEGDLPLSYDS